MVTVVTCSLTTADSACFSAVTWTALCTQSITHPLGAHRKAAHHELNPARDFVSLHSLKSKKGWLLPSKVLLIQVWQNVAEYIELIPTLLGCFKNGGKAPPLPAEASCR